ncbi:lipopolysaccharide kinase InaA family protein [Larsenimonas rhizosphaerae]|uniref:lipopolysaccharide kinase InaA family protein n=1 Tax=Larsenimonas rhizosphaerae TaxID=2944682 RepID=UPI0020338305|nr:lipopolysaccharide kinase InaA family protein [Larsenimonas rhizosphaerae]MCM2132064.1 lipopolysaccharide kinase InaA family protein [Larsenimonas rhizosphaerae]
MKNFTAPSWAPLLQRHHINTFDALWNLDLEPVDVPNLERGGHSEVSLLTLEDQRFFVKRQTNHLGRSLQRPFGEPTFAREFRNIQRFEALNIPALEAAWFGERRSQGTWCSILVTPALEGYSDLIAWHARWNQLSEHEQVSVIEASARLLATLHDTGWMHGSLYAKHVFLKSQPGHWEARLIDLEKSRPLLRRTAERLRDLDVFTRRLTTWQPEDWTTFFTAYAGTVESGRFWQEKLNKRLKRKGKS